MEMLASAERVRVAAPAGTDLSFGMGPEATMHPILAIAPLYGEVAVTPAHGTESGVIVVDMATQMGVRPTDELDREPLRIEVEDGQVASWGGDPVQVGRFAQYIDSGDPPARNIDEVGIVTTQIKINDPWWRDGCHYTETVHIAPGNKTRRDAVVHGARHMDGQISRPTISLDGQVIMRDGQFVHERLL
jgi:leucyl aminopeptidase (aminopeptidase T)